MSDASWILLVLSVVVTAIVAVIKGLGQAAGELQVDMARNRAVRAHQAEDVRLRSERRALELLVEFPEATDDFIAQLMRDELMNMRSQHREYYDWATPDTVGRMRRTLVVEAVRRSREK